MKIAIDVSRIVNEKAGIGRCTSELVRALLKIDKKNRYLLICTFIRGEKSKKALMETFAQKNVEIKYLKLPGKLKETIWHSRLPIVKKILAGADVYLAPTFLDVITNLAIPQVVIIHDLSTFRFPQHLGKKLAIYFDRQTEVATRLAKKIICISESTKRDLIKILHVEPKKIQVIYPGNALLPPAAANLPAGLKSRAYILTVGTLEPRKNFSSLFKAYALLPLELQEQHPLVVVGGKGWNTGEIFELILQLKLDDKVKFLGHVDDKVLAKLYQEAEIFVYPSLYEGFGLPVLEALGFGLPVITSNTSSLPEVVGEAGVLIDPTEPKSIARALQHLLEHKNIARKLSQAAFSQAKKFSWKTTAIDVLKLLESLVE